jgi:hypothetical protein
LLEENELNPLGGSGSVDALREEAPWGRFVHLLARYQMSETNFARSTVQIAARTSREEPDKGTLHVRVCGNLDGNYSNLRHQDWIFQK